MTRALQELTAGATCWPADALRCAKQALEEIAKLRAREDKHLVRRSASSDKDLAAFQQWLTTHAEATRVAVKHVGDHGHGLVAVDELQQGEAFISIPYDVILSADATLGPPTDSKPWEQVAQDPLLARFPSCLLALRVLSEACKPRDGKESAYFKPYLSVLPSTFAIPLYYEGSDFDAIDGTSLFDPAVKLLYNSIKQFFYLQRLRQQAWTKCPIPKEKFTLSNYFWALGVVLTRQNEVVVGADGRATMALIPGWDMCNHEAGNEITTFSDPVKRRVVCHAKRVFKANDQITMFYGPRSNQDLLVYSGFVSDANPYDLATVNFTLDTNNDPLAKIRRMIVQKELAKDPLLVLQEDAVQLKISGNGSLASYGMLRVLQLLFMTKDSLTKALRTSLSMGSDEVYEWTAEERKLAKEEFAAACEVAAREYQSYVAKTTNVVHAKLFERYFLAQRSAVETAKQNADIFAS